ncbi:TIGR02391 family protein [Nonomuraea terrae]|uniref:TIGR02391 family protein n=1 Tax=Nonomuraea terrae TaxID=2530383 RepID=UPI0037AB81D2
MSRVDGGRDDQDSASAAYGPSLGAATIPEPERPGLLNHEQPLIAAAKITLVNIQWCIERLELYASALEELDHRGESRMHLSLEDALRNVQQLSRTAHTIMRRLDPTMSDRFSWDDRWQIEQDVNATIGMLHDWKEVEENLGPGGPLIYAAQLHPWVWDAASTFWDAGHYREAVAQAARSISAHTQSKIGRTDISEGNLLKQAFSKEDPKPGAPRLRFTGDRSTETWRSRQEGAVAFAFGCFTGIRNVATHQHMLDWDEQEAFQYLTAFSVLARWVDECEVETTEDV